MPIRSFQEKLALLQEWMTAGATISDHNIIWRIFEPKIVEHSLGTYIVGYLGRYKEQTAIEVASQKGAALDTLTIENLVSAKASFFLHVKSGVMAYHCVKKLIEPEIFRFRFTLLLLKGAGNFFVDIDLDVIEEQFKLREEVKRLQRVASVEIELFPSNPSNRLVWQKQDERLKSLRATKYREHYESKGDQFSAGLQIKEDADIDSKIVMAEDGYGKVTVVGERQGSRVTISTSDNPVNTEAPTIPDSPERILEFLAPTFQRIFDRFKE